MNTIHNFPAAKLPAELRGDLSADELVTVTVAQDNDDVSYDDWLASFKQTLAKAKEDLEAGHGIPAKDVFEDMRKMVSQMTPG